MAESEKNTLFAALKTSNLQIETLQKDLAKEKEKTTHLSQKLEGSRVAVVFLILLTPSGSSI